MKGPKNADVSLNGCPDTDGDGVYDKDDACVDKPGIKTSDPKTNGCPDPDRDKDGIKNEDDACPDGAGKPDPDPKRNGCPKAFVQAGQIKILDQVKFKTNSADILPGKDSEEVLVAVLDVLKGHAEIKKVRVEGHTDNKGSAALNRKLSANRAASVVKWLVSHGIDAARLTSAGFGPDKPIDDNKTEAGRRQNRRVEFHIE
ncbi:MAG: OmpA family protein [Polyangiaceae bacterium]